MSEARANQQAKKSKKTPKVQKNTNIDTKKEIKRNQVSINTQSNIQNSTQSKNIEAQMMLQSLMTASKMGEELIKQDQETGEKFIDKNKQKESIKDAGYRLDSSQVQNKSLNDKIMLSKENILSFANQIKESVKNYKPPFTRLSLELNPKELGRVEVTITQKGKDLQISITSNTQAIALFAQNQNDLRNSLQSIGFNQVDMNFSQSGGNSGGMGGNGNGDSTNRQKRNKNGLQVYEQANNLAEGTFDSLEIRLPKYV